MKVYTTGQVAKICGVVPRTVTGWFDSGKLKGYKIPGSQDRRIPERRLTEFLKENGMEDCIDRDKVLVFSICEIFKDTLKKQVGDLLKVVFVRSGFELGLNIEEAACVVFQLDCANAEAMEAANSISCPKLLILNPNNAFAFRMSCFDKIINKQENTNYLTEIKEVLGHE